MKILATLPILLLAACASTAPPTARQRFDQADANNDGRVTRNETADLMIGEAFAMYDADGNGLVSEQEFVASGGTAEQFRRINVSGTGQGTLAEAKANPAVFQRMTMNFDEADANRDGGVTYEELLAYKAKFEAAVR